MTDSESISGEQHEELRQRWEERKAIAKQILQERRDDRNLDWRETRNRSGIEYVQNMRGLQYFLDYIKNLLPIVYDVGAGTTEGVETIRKIFGDGITVRATVLSYIQELEKYLGSDNVLITEAEALRGIANESVGGYLASYSIDYSKFPDIVAQRLFDTLVREGVIKANLFLRSSRIPPALREAGFIVAEYKREPDKRNSKRLILAIKPGDKTPEEYTIVLENLYKQDYETQYEQVMKMRQLR